MTDDKTIAEIERRSRSRCPYCSGDGEVAYSGEMVQCRCQVGIADSEKSQAITDRATLLAIVKRQRDALRDIAKQRLHSEIADCDPDEIDWLSGYEGCVKRAREALP